MNLWSQIFGTSQFTPLASTSDSQSWVRRTSLHIVWQHDSPSSSLAFSLSTAGTFLDFRKLNPFGLDRVPWLYDTKYYQDPILVNCKFARIDRNNHRYRYSYQRVALLMDKDADSKWVQMGTNGSKWDQKHFGSTLQFKSFWFRWNIQDGEPTFWPTWPCGIGCHLKGKIFICDPAT